MMAATMPQATNLLTKKMPTSTHHESSKTSTQNKTSAAEDERIKRLKKANKVETKKGTYTSGGKTYTYNILLREYDAKGFLKKVVTKQLKGSRGEKVPEITAENYYKNGKLILEKRYQFNPEGDVIATRAVSYNPKTGTSRLDVALKNPPKPAPTAGKSGMYSYISKSGDVKMTYPFYETGRDYPGAVEVSPGKYGVYWRGELGREIPRKSVVISLPSLRKSHDNVITKQLVNVSGKAVSPEPKLLAGKVTTTKYLPGMHPFAGALFLSAEKMEGVTEAKITPTIPERIKQFAHDEPAAVAAWWGFGAAAGAVGGVVDLTKTGVGLVANPLAVGYKTVTSTPITSQDVETYSGILNTLKNPGAMVDWAQKQTALYGPLYVPAYFAAQQKTIPGAAKYIKGGATSAGMWLDIDYPFRPVTTLVKGKMAAAKLKVAELTGGLPEPQVPEELRQWSKGKDVVYKGSFAEMMQTQKPSFRYAGQHIAAPDYDVIVRGVTKQHSTTIGGVKADILPESSLSGVDVREAGGYKFQSPSQYIGRKAELVSLEPGEIGRSLSARDVVTGEMFPGGGFWKYKEWLKKNPSAQRIVWKDIIQLSERAGSGGFDPSFYKMEFKLRFKLKGSEVLPTKGRVLVFEPKSPFEMPVWRRTALGTAEKTFRGAKSIENYKVGYPSPDVYSSLYYPTKSIPPYGGYPASRGYIRYTKEYPSSGYAAPSYPLSPYTTRYTSPRKYAPSVPYYTLVSPEHYPKYRDYKVAPKPTPVYTPPAAYPHYASPRVPRYVPSMAMFYAPPRLVPPVPKIIRVPSTYNRSKKRIAAYRAFARSKGRWIPVSAALPKALAIRAGVRYTSYNPARSFTIKPAGTTTAHDIGFVSLKKYRARAPKSKIRGQPVWVEKTKYAIESPGELRGITMKGLASRKRARSPNYAKLLGIKPRKTKRRSKK